MGGKRGYARAILGALGLRQGLGAREVWLNDPGPWGPVWRVLTTPGKAEDVAAIIRGWKDEEPRALWERLNAEGWGELAESADVASYALQHWWSFSWKGPDKGYGGPGATDGGNWGQQARDEALSGEKLASRVEAVARWLVCAAGAYRYGNPDSGMSPDRMCGHPAKSNFGALEPVTAWLPNRVRLSSWPVPVRTFTGSALEVPIPEDCEGVFCYIDPPYANTTGYQHDLSRVDVLEVARRWSDAGATVCISEAEPLELEGWHHVEITSERKGQKRTFSKQQREWLTMNREPAWRPSVQIGMFGDTAAGTR